MMSGERTPKKEPKENFQINRIVTVSLVNYKASSLAGVIEVKKNVFFAKRPREAYVITRTKVEKEINFHDTVFIPEFFVPVFRSGIFFNKLENSKISPQNKPIQI